MKRLREEICDWWIALLGCIPGRSGRLLRRLYYRTVLAGSGPVLSIGEHVESGRMLLHLRQSKIDFAQGFEISAVQPL